jgi:hypothetical protein
LLRAVVAHAGIALSRISRPAPLGVRGVRRQGAKDEAESDDCRGSQATRKSRA